MASVRIAAALLASGLASRFGSNKLEAMLGDTMLGLYAARTLASANTEWLMAVCNPLHAGINSALGVLGFETLNNAAPESGLSHSLALAAHAAERLGADALLIALADMPSVTPPHIQSLIEAFGSHDGMQCVTSACGGQRMPPAIFPRAMFPNLMKMKGDTGARSLLGGAVVVEADPAILADIDTAEDLARLSGR